MPADELVEDFAVALDGVTEQTDLAFYWPINAQFSHYGMNDVPLMALMSLVA